MIEKDLSNRETKKHEDKQNYKKLLYSIVRHYWKLDATDYDNIIFRACNDDIQSIPL